MGAVLVALGLRLGFAADPFNGRLDVRIKVRRLAEHVRRIQEPGG